MNSKKKFVLRVLTVLFIIAIVPMAVGASRLFSKEETEAILPPKSTDPYLEMYEKVIDDTVTEDLLGYIDKDNLKPETPSDAADAEQNARILRKK